MDAQTQFWASESAMVAATQKAAFTHNFNLNVCGLQKQMGASSAQGTAVAGAGGQVGGLAAAAAQLAAALWQAGGAGGA